MAKKITKMVKLQVPAGKATPGSAGRSGPRPGRREHYVFRKGF